MSATALRPPRRTVASRFQGPRKARKPSGRRTCNRPVRGGGEDRAVLWAGPLPREEWADRASGSREADGRPSEHRPGGITNGPESDGTTLQRRIDDRGRGRDRGLRRRDCNDDAMARASRASALSIDRADDGEMSGRRRGRLEHHGRRADRPAAADVVLPDRPDSAACLRCGRTNHAIVGDGAIVCRICVMAWGALAGAISSGPAIREPDRTALAHREHRVPRLGCAWCHGEARWAGSIAGWQPPDGRPAF